MNNYLVIQVLGSSDIEAANKSSEFVDGYQLFNEDRDLDDILDNRDFFEEEFEKGTLKVKFPLIANTEKILIQKLANQNKKDINLHWLIILTNQVEWASQPQRDDSVWNEIVIRDGIWWKNILQQWCDKNGINCCLKEFEIPHDLEYGAADWEGMAKAITPFLKTNIILEEDETLAKTIQFKNCDDELISIDGLFVQHSSGTPALSSALYLWGIEKKLDQYQIEFIYLSEQGISDPYHSGEHWQWRLRVPQIRELVKIQDFGGALELLKGHQIEDQQLEDDLTYLDKAVSLNIEDRNISDERDKILERLAIALWSEQAFRERSQWMHWYLRMAGAFELAIYLLIEQQSKGQYQWKNADLVADSTVKVNLLGITALTRDLLSKGTIKVRFNDSNLQVDKITDPHWNKFVKQFYISNWQLQTDVKKQEGFNDLRNSLYHNLRGDRIDKILDEQTQKLGSVTALKHPSQKAIDHFHYILDLADIETDVEDRANKYREKAQNLMDNLQ